MAEDNGKSQPDWDPLDLGEFAGQTLPTGPEAPPTVGYYNPQYWERVQQPRWTDENGNDVSVYAANHQELAWIRRILLHGEEARSQLIRADVEFKETQNAYSANQAKLIRSVGKYTLTRIGFGVVQTAILGGILWQLWS